MEPKTQLAYLLTPAAVRDQCNQVLALAETGQSPHFRIDRAALMPTADYVLKVIKSGYPALDIPLHSRWRHFDQTRMTRLDEAFKGLDAEEVARRKIELAIVSVLLDAGAGMAWRYTDPVTQQVLSKSEGLAIASCEMFLSGLFADDPESPAQVDTRALKDLTRAALAEGFQTSAKNPLVGLDGRLALMHKLGNAVERSPKIFGDVLPRLGNMYDYLVTHAGNGKLPARKILAVVLEGLGSIWPGRVTLAGTNLGDVWRLPGLAAEGQGGEFVPFHKLSQWLTYSLIEPLSEAGLEVHGLDQLTGLAEYRNGGLFVDLGVIVPKSPEILTAAHAPQSEVIVTWRALTLALLDQTAELIRQSLGLNAEELPLAKVLQGGTWTAGRLVAAERRQDGGPPIRLASDGTVF